jgi:uncharacterized repeat protein (TIGR02543 family)
MERSKPYKGAARLGRLGRLTLGIVLPVAMALGMSAAVAPAATAATSTCTPDVSTIAQCFPDPNLAFLVAHTAGAHDDDGDGNPDADQPLTKHDIASITDLTVNDLGDGDYDSSTDFGITNLQGIENLTNLTSLDLSHNQISDVSPLAKLTKLTDLDLSWNQISDVSPLSRLTKLTELILGDNQISDVSPLANLTNLTELDLSHNQISDVSPLAKLTNLTELELWDNQISDVSPLAKLTKLTTLYLEGNQISDVGPLAKLTNLTDLDLDTNQISDASPLAKLTNLTELELWNNQISDASPLAKLTKLTTLILSGNRISDAGPLAKLTNLTWLTLDGNQVSDVSPLAKLTKLTRLTLDGNQVSDVSPLAKLTKLGANDGWLYLGPQSVSLPVAAASSLSVPTARSVDGSFIKPDKLTPSSGTYDAKTGKASWKGLSGSGDAVLHASTTVTIGEASSQFDVTITQPYTPPTAPVVKYAVSFDAQGGSPVASQSVAKGGKATKPADPMRSGYTFNGWTSDKTGSKPYDFNTAVTANLTLYAQWKTVPPAKIVTVLSAAGSFNVAADSASVSATLKDSAGKPVTGASVTFATTDGKTSASAKTDASGIAKASLTSLKAATKYTVGATYAGDATRAASTLTTPITFTTKTVSKPTPGAPVAVYRVYNPHSGLHHYTTSPSEKNALVNLGWKDEGTSFNAAQQNSASGLLPVYREYNPYNGTHNWTLSPSEHKKLVSLGWRDEGIAWYASPSGPVTVYRLYNPYSGEHVYTTSAKEYTAVGKAGWRQEGTAWQGL